jgi:lysophospholipase L1-like esterase
MYGTNDMDKSTLDRFTTNMNTIVDIIEAHGTVPVLSTVPDRHDTTRAAGDVPLFNAAIRSIAASRHVPLIDYNVALAPLPNQGVGPDGVHPDSWNNNGDIQACVFTTTALQYGYNMRNLTAIQMLDRLRAY